MAVAPQEFDGEQAEIANDPRGGPELPHAVDAERSLVGALMLNNELFAAAEDAGLAAEHFYDSRHKTLFAAMRKMQAEGKHADPVTTAHLLRESGELRNGGGAEYIAALADIGAAPVNAPAYAKLVRDTAMLRAMIDALAQSHIRAFRSGGDPPGKILDEAESRLLSVGDKFARHVAEVRPVGPVAQAHINLLAEIVQTKNFDKLRGYSTGFPDLDEKTAGLHGGELVILAGRPGAGKTAFAMNIARHVTAENVGVCFFSLEMSAEQLVMRLLSQGEVDAQKMRTGRNLNHSDLTRMAEIAAELQQRDLYIDDSGALNILEAKARVRRLGRKLRLEGKKLGLVVVDYLQLLESDPDERSGENRATQVAVISRGLKALARDMNVPILALSQLNRAVDNRPNRRPMLSDLRESGAIEQDADLVLFLHQDEGKVGAAEPEEIELIIGKQRNGPVGNLRLLFNKRFSKFASPARGAWQEE